MSQCGIVFSIGRAKKRDIDVTDDALVTASAEAAGAAMSLLRRSTKVSAGGRSEAVTC